MVVRFFSNLFASAGFVPCFFAAWNETFFHVLGSLRDRFFLALIQEEGLAALLRLFQSRRHFGGILRFFQRKGTRELFALIPPSFHCAYSPHLPSNQMKYHQIHQLSTHLVLVIHPSRLVLIVMVVRFFSNLFASAGFVPCFFAAWNETFFHVLGSLRDRFFLARIQEEGLAVLVGCSAPVFQARHHFGRALRFFVPKRMFFVDHGFLQHTQSRVAIRGVFGTWRYVLICWLTGSLHFFTLWVTAQRIF